MAVITISRQFGAGGKTLGIMLAEKLGYCLFDNELIQMVAEKAQSSEDAVKFIEKESSGKFLGFIKGIIPKQLTGIIPRAVADSKDRRSQDTIDEEVYVDVLHAIIKKIAEEGNAVIIGRGSQYILKGHLRVFHILVSADKEYRISFLEKYYNLSEQEALKAVEMDDRRRANLYRKFGKDDYDSPQNYHLVINTSRIDLNTACEMVCELVKNS